MECTMSNTINHYDSYYKCLKHTHAQWSSSLLRDHSWSFTWTGWFSSSTATWRIHLSVRLLFSLLPSCFAKFVLLTSGAAFRKTISKQQMRESIFLRVSGDWGKNTWRDKHSHLHVVTLCCLAVWMLLVDSVPVILARRSKTLSPYQGYR